MKTLKVFKLTFFLICLLLLSSCLDKLPPLRHQYLKEWTVIVYMIADNDLDYFSDTDINEMEEVGSNNEVDFIVKVFKNSHSV